MWSSPARTLHEGGTKQDVPNCTHCLVFGAHFLYVFLFFDFGLGVGSRSYWIDDPGQGDGYSRQRLILNCSFRLLSRFPFRAAYILPSRVDRGLLMWTLLFSGHLHFQVSIYSFSFLVGRLRHIKHKVSYIFNCNNLLLNLIPVPYPHCHWTLTFSALVYSIILFFLLIIYSYIASKVIPLTSKFK